MPNCGAQPEITAHPALGITAITFLHSVDCPVAELLNQQEP